MTEQVLHILQELGEEAPVSETRLALPTQIALNLKLTSDFSTIQQALRTYEVPFLLVKGLATQALLTQKQPKIPGDWDLIVPNEPKAIWNANKALETLGFRQFYPHFSRPVQWQAWHRFGKAQVYQKSGQLDVDLHWRLFSQWIGIDIPFVNLWERRQTIDIGSGHEAETLGNEDTLVFLCLHCAQDGWSSLKSLWEIHLALKTLPVNTQTLLDISDLRWPLVVHTFDLANWIFAHKPGKFGGGFATRTEAMQFLRAKRNQPTDTGPALLQKKYWQGNWRCMLPAATGLLTPSVEDISSASLPYVWLYPLWRCGRLVKKFIWRSLLPRPNHFADFAEP